MTGTRFWLLVAGRDAQQMARPVQTAGALADGRRRGLDQADVSDGNETFWEAEYRQHLARRALLVMQADFQTPTWRAFWSRWSPKGRSRRGCDLGLSRGAVYTARFRVLDRLRHELAGLLDESFPVSFLTSRRRDT